MNVLVTGGTGFVGKPFVRKILQDGWHVSLITRDKKKTTALSHPNLTACEGDVSDDALIDRIVETGQQFDAVFHLAASLNYFGDRREIHRINVQGTRNVLNLAVRTSAKKFIYASSIEAVGPVTRKEVPASPAKACKPISPYGETKLLAERLVMTVACGHFSAMCLRIGNVYGPDHFSFVLEIAQAILARNRLLEFLPVYADRYLHPVHNDDVTAGILAAYRSNGPSAIVTLSGEYATVGELFQICAQSIGQRIRPRQKKWMDQIYVILLREYTKYRKSFNFISYLMAGAGKRVHRAYSLEESRKVLGFSPQVDLRSGIAQTLQWARKQGLLVF